MKLRTLLLFSHIVASLLTTAALVAAVELGNPILIAGAALVSLLVVIGGAWFVIFQIESGLAKLELAVTDHEQFQSLSPGLVEFDRAGQHIANTAANWESVAADTRNQAREVQEMMMMLNRRVSSDQPTSQQLQSVLSALGHSLDSHLNQIQQSTSEIEQRAKSITEGSEAQVNTVIKTTTYVEQLSATIDTVASSAQAAHDSTRNTCQSASQALTLLSELNDGMNRVRDETQNCEKKLRGLCDPSRQISAIVDSISDIAARTGLLALNASIESIRAGEHGRGFAIVAEEVRKLAEQATDATHEISSLLDAMQLVTQDSIREIEREREQVEVEVARVGEAKQTLQRICESSDQDVLAIRRISESSTQQLQLTQDFVLAVEQISSIAKANRGGAESVCWTTKSLVDTNPGVRQLIHGLRDCGSGMSEQDRPVEQPTTNAVPVPVVPTTTPEMTPVG